MEHIEYAHTRGMDSSEVEERLTTTKTGVLSLSRNGDAYSIPLNHYYDGSGLYFRLGKTENSKKWDFLETTDTACYVIYGAEETDEARGLDSWSIIVSGQLNELPESEYGRFDTAEINRQFSPIRVFGEDIDAIEVVIAEMEIESMTGRRTTLD